MVKLPKAAVEQIETMVRSMLPYEDGYVPKTAQSRLINELYTAVATPNPPLQKWSGFVMYLMKQIDSQPSKQKEVDCIAETMYDVLTQYGYGDVKA